MGPALYLEDEDEDEFFIFKALTLSVGWREWIPANNSQSLLLRDSA